MEVREEATLHGKFKESVEGLKIDSRQAIWLGKWFCFLKLGVG